MVVSDPEKALRARLLAARLRQAADETAWPRYRAKLLLVADDLESEAESIDLQQNFAPRRGASRAG